MGYRIRKGGEEKSTDTDKEGNQKVLPLFDRTRNKDMYLHDLVPVYFLNLVLHPFALPPDFLHHLRCLHCLCSSVSHGQLALCLPLCSLNNLHPPDLTSSITFLGKPSYTLQIRSDSPIKYSSSSLHLPKMQKCSKGGEK